MGTQLCLILHNPKGCSPQVSLSMEFPSKNIGVGCHSLLQRIFLTQGWIWCLLHWKQILSWATRDLPLAPFKLNYVQLFPLGITLQAGWLSNWSLDMQPVIVQSVSRVWLSATPWTAAWQASPVSSIISQFSNSCPLSQRWYPTILSSAIPFSFCLQSFPASRAFPMSQLFASSSQSFGTSASVSVLPINIWA